MVRQAEPPRVHQLNNTMSIVLDSCDGQRTVAEIAEMLAEAFGLGAPRSPRRPPAWRNSAGPESFLTARTTRRKLA